MSVNHSYVVIIIFIYFTHGRCSWSSWGVYIPIYIISHRRKIIIFWNIIFTFNISECFNKFNNHEDMNNYVIKDSRINELPKNCTSHNIYMGEGTYSCAPA